MPKLTDLTNEMTAAPASGDLMHIVDISDTTEDPNGSSYKIQHQYLFQNYLNKDGSVALTANWDVGSFKITALQFESDIVTSTAPFIVASTTKVANLNADQVDGFDLDQAVLIASSPTFAGLTLSGLAVANGIVQTDGAGVLSSSVTLPDGTLATTQALSDSSTKLATTAFVQSLTMGALWTTVGNAGSGAEYNSIEDARAAGKYALAVIGNFTETKDVTIGANTVNIKITDTCNMATYRFIASGAGDLIFESGKLTSTLAGGTDLVTLSSTGELYMSDMEGDISGSSGVTGIASGSATNRMHIDNCRFALYNGSGAGFKNLYNNSSVTNCTFVGGGSSCNQLIDNMNGGIISNITVNGTIQNLQNIISIANESAIVNGIHSNTTNRGIISLEVNANQIDNLNGDLELDLTDTSENQVSNCYIADIDLSDSSAGRNKFTNIHNISTNMVIAGSFNQFCNFESDADITIDGGATWFSHARAVNVTVNGNANQNIICSFTTYTDNGSDNSYVTGITATVDSSSTNLTFATSASIYDLFKISALGTPTYTTIQDFIDLSQGASAWDGFDITDGGSGTVDIAAGEGLIKSTDSGIGANFSFDYAGTAGLALTDNNTNYIYIDYNSGTPIAAATITFSSVNLRTQIMIGRVYRDGSTLHILEAGQFFEEYQTKSCKKDFELYGFQRASGEIIGETGTRNITVTAGVDYCAHNRITTPAIDTSGADHFDVWNSSASTTPDAAGVSAVDNANYWNGSAVTALTVNRYGTRFFYRDFDGHIQMQYGTSNAVSIATALAETVPVPPVFLRDFSIYIGRIVIRQGVGSFAEITNPFETPEQGTSVTDHGDLAGLTDDDHAQYLLLAGRSGQTVNDDVTFNNIIAGTVTAKADADGYILTTALSTAIEIDVGDDVTKIDVNHGTKDVDYNIWGTDAGAPLFHIDAGSNLISLGSSSVDANFKVTIDGGLKVTNDIGLTGTRISKGWFTDFESTNMYTVSGTSINANGVLDLTSAEVSQLANIGATTISAAQWVYLGATNQGISTTDDVVFNKVTSSDFDINGGDISAVTISGSLTWSAAQDLNNQNLTNVDIDSGTIDGVSIGATTPTTTIAVDQLLLNDAAIIVAGAGTDLTFTPKGAGVVIVGRNSATNSADIVARNTDGSATLIADRHDDNDNYALVFKTNNVTKWQIGNLSTGSETLDFTGAGEWMTIGQGNGEIFFPAVYADTVTSARDLEIQSDGQIGYVSSILASKKNIEDFDASFIYDLEPKICNMRLKDEDENYTDECSPEKEYVLIAEDVEKVNKDFVFYDDVDGQQELRGVYYKKLIAPLIKCIQEQKTRIDKLELRLKGV